MTRTRLMGDVSQFMKLVKQRLSVWFNRTHNRYGTLWAERLKSVLVEPCAKVVETKEGLRTVLGGEALPDWEQAQGDYRVTLFGVGSAARPGAGTVSPAEMEKVVKARGRLPRHVVLRRRLRHFSDGAVLGGQAFVAQHLAVYREKTGRRRRSQPKPLPSLTDWGLDLATLRGLRVRGA